jgi:hypothetical protein
MQFSDIVSINVRRRDPGGGDRGWSGFLASHEVLNLFRLKHITAN